jgi:methionine synthase II (cobalamin-independent)
MAAKLHRNPPFRAEHLGSLLRTERLLEVRHANEAGKAKDSELRAVEDTDVKDIVKLQLDLGYHAITDGEYRRHSTYPGSPGICFGSQTHIR